MLDCNSFYPAYQINISSPVRVNFPLRLFHIVAILFIIPAHVVFVLRIKMPRVLPLIILCSHTINKLSLKKKNLPKNYYVSTGTCTRAIPISKGDNITADFGNLGKVSFIYK